MSFKSWQKAFMTVSLGVLILFTLLGVGRADVLGYWAMDDPNYPTGYFDVTPRTTADGSGNGNDGMLSETISVGEATGFDGVGKAADFFASDPAAAIDCGMDPSIKPTAAGYSFATWVKFDDVSSGWQLVASDWNDGGTAGEKYFYHFGLLNDTLTLYLSEPGTNSVTLYASSGGTEYPLATDTWMHIGFSVTPGDGATPGEVCMYRDGALASSIMPYASTSLPYTSEPVILGAKTSDGIFPLHGQLDSTAIWSSGLSETDFYNLGTGTSPLSVSSSTLGGFWDYETVAPLVTLPTATVVDSSGNGYDGILTPDGVDPFHPTSGRFGGAVLLDGTEGSNINVGDINGTTTAMTFSAWVKPDDLDGLQIVASQSDDSSMTDWGWQIFLLGGNAQFYVYNPVWDGTGDSFMLAGLAEGITTDWNHLAMTMTANNGSETGEVTVYLNGVQVGTALEYDTDSLMDSSADIVLGNKAGSSPLGLRGLIDDAVLLDEALSPEDIAYLYTHPASELGNPKVPGDANGDGQVDGSDVTILANNWQAGVGDPDPINITWAMGDFNGDGQVDGSDVTILANNWQYGVTSSAATVPEPSSLVLLLAAVAGLFLVRRKFS